VEFRYLSDMSREAMLAAVSSAPSESIIFYMAMTGDATGKTFNPRDVAERVSQVSKSPVFGIYETLLDHGIVGGSIVSYGNIGTQAGQLAISMLRTGSDHDNTSEIFDVPGVPMFDWQQLRRWNLSVGDLPEGSIIINRALTLWDFKYYIIVALAFLVAQSLLILMLLAQKRRRRSAEESLRQSENRLRLITDSLPVLIAYIDSTQRYQFNNKAYVDWFGVTPAGALGRTVREVVGETLYQDILPYIEKALSGEHVSYVQDVELGSGRKVNLEGIYVPDVDENNLVRGFYALVLDATEKNAAREESKRLQDDLAHASRITTLGELTGALAHEINQPLSAIMSNAKAAKRFLTSTDPDLKEVEEILDDIVAEDARASQVISRLRSLLKKAPSAFEKVDFNQVINEVTGFVHSNAAMREVRISSDLASDLPPIKGDRIQLQQVVLNLLTNAFEAVSEKPPGERQVCIRSWLEDSAIQTSISDNGAGIAAEEVDNVFKPFFTTKAQGLGMGLSISRSIIIRHQGQIWAENNPDVGTTFYFSLPAESA